AELAGMGLTAANEADSSVPEDNSGGVGQYYGSGNSAMPATPTNSGLSGAGRGRYGRVRTTKSPLGVSSDGLNARTSRKARDWMTAGTNIKGNLSLFFLELRFFSWSWW